ncbi:MAG: protein-L-isoaspartate(D-aspartate) O-methyltransferase [Hyphomonadaceae bacterium]
MIASDAQRMRLILGLRQIGVTNARLLSAIERTPRAQFVAPHLAGLAWEDEPLPIEGGRQTPKPSEAARVLAALAPGQDDSVLEIGTGSGWQTAVLARLSRRVVSLERRRGLADAARDRLGGMGFTAVRVHWADGGVGWAEEAPYDRIVVNAAIHIPRPAALIEQLRPGGVLAAAVTDGPRQILTRVRLSDDGETEVTTHGPVRFPEIEAGVEY